MPIRTHRGRAAVYRRFWAWPLRSPKHLAVFVTCATVVAFALVNVMPESRRSPIPNNNPAFNGQTITTMPRTGAGSPLTTFVPPPPENSLPQAAPPHAQPPAEAVDLARTWAKVWINHPEGMSPKQWLDQLRPHTTEEYLPVMASVDPANVPDRLNGEAKVIRSEVGAVDIRQGTNGGDVIISVISTPAGWKVAKYAKVDP